MRLRHLLMGAMAGLCLPSSAAMAAEYEPLDPRFWGNVVAAPDLLALLAHLKGTAILPRPPLVEAENPDLFEYVARLRPGSG